MYMYVEILEKTLFPFINDVYPDSHRFMADNDSAQAYVCPCLGISLIILWTSLAS